MGFVIVGSLVIGFALGYATAYFRAAREIPGIREAALLAALRCAGTRVWQEAQAWPKSRPLKALVRWHGVAETVVRQTGALPKAES